MKLTKKSVYIGLFSILYLIVAFSSFFHACSFFGLANNTWMSIILAFAFEVGQAAVLFSLLTSSKDRSRIMPWVLMTMFTLVQVIGNVYSSYKYIVTNSVDDLRYFKEPIFIWTSIPDDQATVIIVYLVGALLPIAALLLTSMITNYLSDQEEAKQIENKEQEQKLEEVDSPEKELDEKQEIDNSNEIENLKKQLEELKNAQKTKEDSQQRMSSTDVGLTPTEESKNDDISQGESTSESQSDSLGEQPVETETITPENTKTEDIEIPSESDKQSDEQVQEQPVEVEEEPEIEEEIIPEKEMTPEEIAEEERRRRSSKFVNLK